MLKYIKNFFKNIKYLFARDLYSFDVQKYPFIYHMNEWHNKEKYNQGLKILSAMKTLDLLLKEPKSFIRFGDGEIRIIKGLGIPQQKSDIKLSLILKKILVEYNEKYYVGINYFYFNDISNMIDYNKDFYLSNIMYAKEYVELCNKDITYIDASFGMLPVIIKNFNFDEYINKIELLFDNKDVVLFQGKGLNVTYKNNLFKRARSVIIEDASKENAFSQYDEILERVKKHANSPMRGGGQQIFCFILGPTGKALIYELSKLNYLAYDIGHMWKAYDYYFMKKGKIEDDQKDFWKPD